MPRSHLHVKPLPVGMFHCKVKNGGLRNELEREMRGSGAGSSVKLGVFGGADL